MAPAASKFASSCNVSCGMIAHPWCPDSCIAGAAEMLKSSAIGCASFITVLYLAKLLLRGPENAKQEARRLPGRVLRASFVGVGISTILVLTKCILRHLLGQFHYWTIGFIPGCVGGLSIFTQHARDIRPILDAFYLTAVEYAVRLACTPRMMARETALFSLLSGALAFLQRTDSSRAPVPWFHWPEHERGAAEEEREELPPVTRRKPVWPLQRLLRLRQAACMHRASCAVHTLDGALKFAGLGAALSVTRGVLPRIRALLSPALGQHSLPPFFNWTLPAFLATYVAVFRVVRCWLCWTHGEDSSLHAACAGLTAGLSYALNPSLAVFAASLAATSELTWRRLAESGSLPAWLSSCPRLVVMLSTGVMVHARCHGSKHTCPATARVILSAATRGRADQMVAQYHKLIWN